MDIGLFILFTVLTIVNVVLNTARTLITVKGGIFVSALISAAAFGFYTIMTIYTMCDLPMWVKATTCAAANFVGVYIVKYAEMWIRKDKLWDVQVVIYGKHLEETKTYLNSNNIQFTDLPITNSSSELFHIYSQTQDDSKKIRDILTRYGAKYFVSESKHL